MEVEFDDPSEFGTLLVGYSADVEIVLAVHENVMRVPTAALVEGNKLYVASSEDGSLNIRQVETGLSNWEYTEIQSKMAVSDRIVLSIEREGLTQGAQVIAESETTTAK